MAATFTFERLRSMTNAFDEFTTIADSDLPDYYKEAFPHECECGGEVIMTKSTHKSGGYTQMQCCNPGCWVKMAHQFAYFMKSMGFNGFGSTGAITLFRELYPEFQSPTFLAIFEVPDDRIASVMGEVYSNLFAEAREVLFSTRYAFKDALAALGIPDLGKNNKLFDLVQSSKSLLHYVINDKMEELCELAQIYSERTRYRLSMARLDMLTLFVNVVPNVYDTPKNEVYIAITGSVSVNGQTLTRSAFIDACDSICDSEGRPVYKIVETKSQSKLNYVIADAPSSSSKYELGEKLGILITAEDFLNMLRKNANTEEVSVDDEQQQS